MFDRWRPRRRRPPDATHGNRIAQSEWSLPRLSPGSIEIITGFRSERRPTRKPTIGPVGTAIRVAKTAAAPEPQPCLGTLNAPTTPAAARPTVVPDDPPFLASGPSTGILRSSHAGSAPSLRLASLVGRALVRRNDHGERRGFHGSNGGLMPELSSRSTITDFPGSKRLRSPQCRSRVGEPA
jgi:hypothetical protein